MVRIHLVDRYALASRRFNVILTFCIDNLVAQVLYDTGRTQYRRRNCRKQHMIQAAYDKAPPVPHRIQPDKPRRRKNLEPVAE